MAISLYDATVAGFQQTLAGVAGFLDRGLAHCHDNNIDPETLVEARLYGDMLPLRFQVQLVAHHSIGAIEAVKAGAFVPPMNLPPEDVCRPAKARGRRPRFARQADGDRGERPGGPRRGVPDQRHEDAVHGAGIPAFPLAAKLLLPRRHGLRHPAQPGGAAGQARFHGPAAPEELTRAAARLGRNGLNLSPMHLFHMHQHTEKAHVSSDVKSLVS